MAKTNFQSIDEYIAAQPEPVQPALERVRAIIRKAVPGAEETISYQIAAFRLNGQYVTYLAGYAQHYSLYPVTDAVVEALGDEVTPYLSGKGTMRFPLQERIPVRLIERIVKVRAKEAAERAKVKAPASKRR